MHLPPSLGVIQRGRGSSPLFGGMFYVSKVNVAGELEPAMPAIETQDESTLQKSATKDHCTAPGQRKRKKGERESAPCVAEGEG